MEKGNDAEALPPIILDDRFWKATVRSQDPASIYKEMDPVLPGSLVSWISRDCQLFVLTPGKKNGSHVPQMIPAIICSLLGYFHLT